MEPRAFKDAVFEQFARAASAFASPKRIEIIDLLVQAERSVESIANATSMTVANASQHLQVLKAAGMVESRRDGNRVVYRLAEGSVADCYRALQRLAERRIAEVSRLAESFFGDRGAASAVTIDDLVGRIAAGTAVLIDVRPSLEFRAGHIPGAINIPLGDLADRMREIPADAEIVAYCRGPYCVLAAEAIARLRADGRNATRLDAGPSEWLAHDFNLETSA